MVSHWLIEWIETAKLHEKRNYTQASVRRDAVGVH